MAAPYSLYLHIPFCHSRCGYCDFNTYAGLEDMIPAYALALCSEIAFAACAAGERLPVHTVFFGGGTPSLLPIAELATILESLAMGFDLSPGVEITLEANPGTLSLEYLQDLHRLGVTRLSLGMQSANPSELRLLERRHEYPDVIRAVTQARQAGFAEINLDLIFGLPGQSLESWQRSLLLAAGLHPEHFSLYALTLEHGTPFGNWAARGLLPLPDPDLAAEMYEWSSDYLAGHGYAQYEISNWAASGPDGSLMACRHNLQYWRYRPYLGFGAGAHGFLPGEQALPEPRPGWRTVNVLSPAAYIQRLSAPHADNLPFPRTPATHTLQPVDRQAEIGETLMMGLRLVRDGVSEVVFQERFGAGLEAVFGKQIKRLTGLGLLEWTGEGEQRALRLTQKGRLLGNQVFLEFI